MPKTLQIATDLAAFHKAGACPDRKTPRWPHEDIIDLRVTLIEEEVKETLTAIRRKDLVEVADGIADSIVVLVGTARALGIDLTPVWNEVHRSNMAKFPKCEPCWGTGVVRASSVPEDIESRKCQECNGRGTGLLLREDGKILKPKGWTPPDIAGVLRAQGADV